MSEDIFDFPALEPPVGDDVLSTEVIALDYSILTVPFEEYTLTELFLLIIVVLMIFKTVFQLFMTDWGVYRW